MRRLTPAERAKVHRLRKTPPDVAIHRRVQAVRFSSRGLKLDQIAEIVNRSRVTVACWLHAFDTGGLTALRPGKSHGRPPKADAEFQAALVAAVAENPRDLGYPFTRWTADLLTEHLWRVTHVDVSSSTVCHTLRRLGYRYGSPKLDLKHRQAPKEVARAKRPKRPALKKRRPAPVVVPSRMRMRPSFTVIPDSLAAGPGLANG